MKNNDRSLICWIRAIKWDACRDPDSNRGFFGTAAFIHNEGS